MIALGTPAPGNSRVLPDFVYRPSHGPGGVVGADRVLRAAHAFRTGSHGPFPEAAPRNRDSRATL
jgi:hypothetical protein